MFEIKFTTLLEEINSHLLIRLPKEASLQLPTRGMSMLEGKINEVEFISPLEPDGRGGHFMEIEPDLSKKLALKVGEKVTIEANISKAWPRPEIPTDLNEALRTSPKAKSIWHDITPNAQWEWLRWIRGTKNIDTRQKRITVALSKMEKGMRRPCCFNHNACTIEAVSHRGQLLENKSS